MSNVLISSASINEETGTARIIIEGYIPAPHECDDPVVELFRPVRNKYKEQMFFTILTKHREESVICDIFASNKRARTVEEFISTAVAMLEGDATGKGVIAEYTKVLEQFFEDEDGLKKYLANIAKAEKLENGKAAAVYATINDEIKNFVTKIGLEMPSIKALTRPKPKKTREQKRADGKAYLAKHPELKTSDKKPAN